MSRWLAVIVIAGAILNTNAVRAQAPTALSTLHVQLWPEYDQPSMLVIYDFQVPQETALPVSLSMKVPAKANLVAVAVQAPDGSLLNADYLESAGDDGWQSVLVQIQSPTVYRIEYYQPLTRSGAQREFMFGWSGDYRVERLGVTARLPADAQEVVTEPELVASQPAGGTSFYENEFGPLGAGEEFALRLSYSRSSNALDADQAELQPSQPLDGSTPGRVMLSEWLPVILGVLGIALVAGGALYFWQSSRAGAPARRRHAARGSEAPGRDSDVYCHQCGTRAQQDDRFCRVCGTRLRTQD